LPSIFLFLFTGNKGNELPNEGLISKHTRRDTHLQHPHTQTHIHTPGNFWKRGKSRNGCTGWSLEIPFQLF